MENVVTLSKFICLLLLLFSLCFVFDNSKNTRNELAHSVMGTIFLVMRHCHCRLVGEVRYIYT